MWRLHGPARFAWAAAASLVIGACSGGSGPPRPEGSPASTRSAPSTEAPLSQGRGVAWTTYQNGQARWGAAGLQSPLTSLRRAWNAVLDGAAVYGQPLVADGRVIVATEADDVYGLDAHDGSVLWKVNVGTPLRDVASAAEAGCGNIDPLGITSTPAIDAATHTVYVVAEVSQGGTQPVSHQLVGIDILTGRMVERLDADPPLPAGERAVNLLQRAALALGNGRIYIGYGGQFGDCGAYHGWLVGLPEASSRSSAVAFDVTPQSSGGAVWQGGAAPSLDPAGHVYISTGNPNSAGPAPWAEAVVKLSPDLASPPEAFFQDRAATGDLDLSTGDPVLVGDGNLFAAGKTDIGYLLRQSDLSQVAPIKGAVCASDPDGGPAYDSSNQSIYLPCQDGGIQRVDLATRVTKWRAGRANSTPILIDGQLWALQYPNGILQEFDPQSGAVLATVRVGRSLPHFASPAAALGLLIVPTTSGVVAFDGPSGPPQPAGGT